MNLSDLHLFVATTQHASLHAAARELSVTPSALSKAIRRLEDSLRTPLFDRDGNKSLCLNANGHRLRQRALVLIDLAEQTRAEFVGTKFRVHCRVAAPALLQWRYAASFAGVLSSNYAESSLNLRPAFEDDAIAALTRGEVDFAFVTNEALRTSKVTESLQSVVLGELTMQLAAGPSHPLAAKARGNTVRTTMEKVLACDFVSPTRSLFCGVERGANSDGWQNQMLPRRIRYWVDDLHVLLNLVQNGKALAYLPEFALRESGLIKVDAINSALHCSETALLVWRPSVAAGWQTVVVDAFCALQE